MADPTRPPAEPHPQHARLVDLAREYLSSDWCVEAQVARYLDRNSPASCPPITPHHVRAVMMTLATQGVAEEAMFTGDRVLHWRRRAVAVA
jgi:hypothetical protein